MMNTKELNGYCMPLSPKGKAQLIGGLPWHFSMDIMAFNFRADPIEIKKLLPEPYQSSAVPDAAFVWFLDALSVWEEGKDLVYVNPERTMYKECQIGVRCRVNDVEGSRCVYIWVDNDFTLLRGWFYGFPKKLARIFMSSSKRYLYEFNHGTGKFGTGTRLQGFCEAHGERLMVGDMKLGAKITPADLKPPFGLPWFNLVHFPTTEVDSTEPLVCQIVQTVGEPPTFGDIWIAEEASLLFFESNVEEHFAIKPIDVTEAYFLTMGLTFKGTKLIHKY